MKNIILIVLDAAEGKMFFNQNSPTPFLNSLKKNSIYGNKMYSEAPFTEAALMSLLSGNNTLDNNGYLGRFLNKRSILNDLADNGYEVFCNHYYPSIVPGHMFPGINKKFYTEGYDFNHLWEYRLKYYKEILEMEGLSKKDKKTIEFLLDDNFTAWLDYFNKIKNNDKELEMIINYVEKEEIEDSIEKLKINIKEYYNNKNLYITKLLKQGKEHTLFSIKDYNPKKNRISVEFKEQVIKKYHYIFKKIRKKQFILNLKNSRFPIKKFFHYILSSDLENALNLIKGYKNLLIDGDLYKRIEKNYDNFKATVSFKTYAEHALKYYSQSKEKKFYYLHINETHHPEMFFTYDTEDMNVIDNEFKIINEYLDNLPKNYKGTISRDLSILYCDNIINQMMKSLEKNGLIENTSLIVTADHGFSFNYYPVREKYVNSYYEENYNVPFMIYNKKYVEEEKKNFFSTMDIGPTILEMANIKSKNKLIGKSIIKFNGRDYAKIEYLGGGCPDMERRKIQLGIRTNNYSVNCSVKITENIIDNIVEVYDLNNDKLEMHNLVKNIEKDKISYEIELLEERLNQIKKEKTD